MNEQDERNISDIVGPGWYLFVTVFSLSMLFYMTMTEASVWYALIYSTFWGSATWGTFGFLVWVIESIDTYDDDKDKKNKTVFTLDPAFTRATDGSIRLDHVSFNPASYHDRAKEMVKKQAEEHIDRLITANGLKLDNTVVVLSDEERKELASFITDRWTDGTLAFGRGVLSNRITDSLKERGYISEHLGSESGRFSLTDKGKKLFPYHLDGIYVK